MGLGAPQKHDPAAHTGRVSSPLCRAGLSDEFEAGYREAKKRDMPPRLCAAQGSPGVWRSPKTEVLFTAAGRPVNAPGLSALNL